MSWSKITFAQYCKARNGMPRPKTVQQLIAITGDKQVDGIVFRQTLYPATIEQAKVNNKLVMVYIIRELDRVYVYDKGCL